MAANGDSAEIEAAKKEIAATIPYYAFKGIDRFYDIGGLLAQPKVFQRCVDIFVERYRGLGVDKIGGLDARGFVFGPPIALALEKPFFMIRKSGKLPNATTGGMYRKEYHGDQIDGGDQLALSKTALQPGDRVLLIDDLIATGGTLIAAIELCQSFQATVVECACMIELPVLHGGDNVRAAYPEVSVWSFIPEELITTPGISS